MLVWLIIVVIMVVSLTVLALLHKSKVSDIEEFQNVSGILGSTTAPSSMSSFLASISGGRPTTSSLKSTTTTFTDGQQNYLENVLGKEVMTNANMPNYANVMNPAVNQPDVYLNTPENIVVRNLQTDNLSQFTEADIQWCKSAKMPENLPPHVRGASVGCGWYYVPDQNLTSSGALGQASGPIFPKGPNSDGINGIPNYGNGQWIWDLSVAQQLEDIKNCARIKTCIAIDAPSVNGVCGFCPSSGVAIPVNVDGTEKYTKTLKIGNVSAPPAVCNTPTIMKGASCPVPPGKEKPLITPQGINCGVLGYPSSDYSIRLYNQNDCTQAMNGIWAPNGECLVMGGNGQPNGSYSAACSALNGVKPASPEPTVCTPDINGRLSAACLITLTRSLGYTQQGAIIKLLQTKNELGMLDKVALQIVKAQNVPVEPVLYKGGIITIQNAIRAYDRLYALIKGGADPMTQQAASWLCIGTNNFDPCNLPDNTPGPFIDQCVEQQWRIAGCQPAGTEYPSEKSVLDGLNTLTWGKVKEIFANTYNAMTSETDPVKQDVAVLRCLGINTKRSMPPPCKGVVREFLVINVDSSTLKNPDGKAAYTMKGEWKSTNAVYNGNLITSGTRVSDAKGVQFDGATVLGTPNLVAQVLGQRLSTKILNGPDPSTVTSPLPPARPSPTFATNFVRVGDIGMGELVEEVDRAEPFFLFNTDKQGGWVPMQQIHRDLAKGIEYEATVKGNNSGTEYSFKINQCSDGTHWVGFFGNSNLKKPRRMMFTGDNQLQYTITKFVPYEFDSLVPVVEGRRNWGDCGMPPGAIGIWTNGDINTPNRYYTGACCSVYIQPEVSKEIIKAVYNAEPTSQKFKVSFITDRGDVWNGGSLTGIGKAFGNDHAWNFIFQRKDGTGQGVGGGTLAPQYQKTAADAAWWNAFTSRPPHFVTVRIEVDAAAIVINETRELWIHPNVDTCEILAVLSGPAYTTSYTVMALFKGELMIALESNEKGYTFFNAGKVPIGQFSHIAHVYRDDGTNEVYINGAGPVVLPEKLTRKNYMGYFGYSLGGGSTKNPLSRNPPRAMPFQGQIGAFRVYNTALDFKSIQDNIAATIDNYLNQVEVATKNDPNALAMAAGKFYVPSLAPAINFQPNPSSA